MRLKNALRKIPAETDRIFLKPFNTLGTDAIIITNKNQKYINFSGNPVLLKHPEIVLQTTLSLTGNPSSKTKFQGFKALRQNKLEIGTLRVGNIHRSGNVCWGRAQHKTRSIAEIWQRFWNSPFNDDLGSVMGGAVGNRSTDVGSMATYDEFTCEEVRQYAKEIGFILKPPAVKREEHRLSYRDQIDINKTLGTSLTVLLTQKRKLYRTSTLKIAREKFEQECLKTAPTELKERILWFLFDTDINRNHTYGGASIKNMEQLKMIWHAKEFRKLKHRVFTMGRPCYTKSTIKLDDYTEVPVGDGMWFTTKPEILEFLKTSDKIIRAIGWEANERQILLQTVLSEDKYKLVLIDGKFLGKFVSHDKLPKKVIQINSGRLYKYNKNKEKYIIIPKEKVGV